MRLFSLAYCSTATKPLTLSDVKKLATKASANNQLSIITGCLIYANKQFFQIIEGSQENLNLLFLKIAKDPAHDKIKILYYQQIEERLFPNWGMGLLETARTREIVKKHFEKDFQPEEFSPKQAENFTTDIKKLFFI